MGSTRADVGLSKKAISMFASVGVRADWKNLSYDEAVTLCDDTIPDAVLQHCQDDDGLAEHGEEVMDSREELYDLIGRVFDAVR